MLKRLATLAALFLSLAAFGQENSGTTSRTAIHRLLLGVNVSPDYCYRTLKNNDGSSLASMIIDVRDESEVYKIGYTAGFNLCYTLTKKLGIELGVQYSNKGYAFKNSALIFGDAIDPRYGIVTLPNSSATPTKAHITYNHHYLDVPVRAIFSFGKKRIHVVASLGVTTNILLSSTQTSTLEFANGDTQSETYDQQNDFNSLNISPSISLGADYRISNKINLRVEPTFRYGLLKISDTRVTAYLWNAGMNVTCYYALN